MECLIRSATPEDTPAIRRVIVSALRTSNAHDYSPDIIHQVEQSFTPKAILQWLTQRDVYVATLDQCVAATASLERDLIRSVFVDPRYQGQGIGRQLMLTLQCCAAQAGIRGLRVPSSITAEGFYTALGFVKIRDEFYGAERTIIMAKALSQ